MKTHKQFDKLAEQCYVKTGSVQTDHFDYVKFAELIVRECITKVEMRKKFATEDQHIVDHAFDLLVYDLESHFGVEE